MNFRILIALLTVASSINICSITKAEEVSAYPKADLNNLSTDLLLKTCHNLWDQEGTAFSSIYVLIEKCRNEHICKAIENPDFTCAGEYDFWFMCYQMLYEKLDAMEGKHVELPIPNTENFIIKRLTQDYINDIEAQLSNYDEITLPSLKTYVKKEIADYRNRIIHCGKRDTFIALINTFSKKELALCLYGIIQFLLNMSKDTQLSGEFTYEELYNVTKKIVEREGTIKEKSFFNYLYRPDQIMAPCMGNLCKSDIDVYFPNKETFLKFKAEDASC